MVMYYGFCLEINRYCDSFCILLIKIPLTRSIFLISMFELIVQSACNRNGLHGCIFNCCHMCLICGFLEIDLYILNFVSDPISASGSFSNRSLVLSC